MRILTCILGAGIQLLVGENVVGKINIYSTYVPHVINILPIPTFYQQEIPQFIFKLPITQQVNGKGPTTKSTLIQLTLSLPSTSFLYQSLNGSYVEKMLRWVHVER